MTQRNSKNNRPYRHVLCVYPYRRELKDWGFLPPVGLEYIASVIQPYADKLEIVDLRREPGHTADFIRPDTDMVCFSVNWERETDFIKKEITSVDAAVTTIIGGRCASDAPDKWLNQMPNIDSVIRGDGEEAMQEICKSLPWDKIEGLSYRHNGQIIHNANRNPGPIHDDMEPCRKLRRHNYDILVNGYNTGLEFDLVSGSRGCPFNCKFCSFSRNPWGVKRKWTARSPESIVTELEHITAPIVAFTDDLFTHDMARVERICDLIMHRGIKKKYIINARLEIAKHPEVMKKMEQAGFGMLLLGIESAHDKTLKSMRKGFNTADIRRYCKALRTTTMFKHGYFILGNIGETANEMLKIAPFAHEIGMDSISLSTLRVSPYSGLEELVAQNPGYYIATNGKIYSDHCPPPQMKKLRRQINREFYNIEQILNIMDKARIHGALRVAPMFLRQIVHGTGRAIGRICIKAAGRGKGQSEHHQQKAKITAPLSEQ